MQTVSLVGTPSGNFTLTYTPPPPGSPVTTGPIPVGATAVQVQSALQAAIGTGTALVTGPAGGPWVVRFAGSLAEANQTDMTGTAGRFSVSVTTTYRGGDTGRAQKMIDPRSLVTKTDFDLLGRTAQTIEAFQNFAPSAGNDRVTQYVYDGGNHILTLTAVLPGSTQQTQYAYGVTTPTSDINSNDLLASLSYPDNGLPRTETFTYNALGERKTAADRNSTVHALSYDVLGKMTSDAATIPVGSSVDRTVQRMDIAYDTGRRPSLFTSYADTSGATVVNQVQRTYNGLSQLISEAQSHSGVVTGTTPTVQYVYSEMPGGANHSRLRQIIYPSGRIVRYEYNAGLDDSISRLSFLADDNAGSVGTHLEEYSYLGLNTVVQRAHPQAQVNLTYIGTPGDGGDQYAGLDRFGRVVDQHWLYTATSTDTDRFQYSYDRDSSRTARTNAVNALFSEQYRNYDNFNQLTSFARGSHTQDWTLDPLGNWTQFNTDVGNQTRSNNVQNQIATLTGTGQYAGQGTPSYDANGNTLIDERGNTFTYDAWNRPASAAGVVFSYDALNRRIVQNPGTATDLYYSRDWQVLEERLSALVTQNVWSPVYVDALVLRDTNLGQRLYVQQDANWNVTGLVNTSGTVVERYAYDPYGKAMVLDPVAWTVRGSGAYGTSSYGWVYLHQGGRYTRFDDLSGLYNFRLRDYSPTLGRWVQQDPIGYKAGDSNLYGYLSESPVNDTDQLGTEQRSGPRAPPKPQPKPDWKDKPLRDRIIPCPCKRDEADALRDKGYNVEEDKGWILEIFHPGADSGVRIWRKGSKDPAGNQCNYDKDGNLITHGPAAGTPDYNSSASDWVYTGSYGVTSHFANDVLAFIWYEAFAPGEGWVSYTQNPDWAPYSDPKCPENWGKCGKPWPRPQPLPPPRPPMPLHGPPFGP